MLKRKRLQFSSGSLPDPGAGRWGVGWGTEGGLLGNPPSSYAVTPRRWLCVGGTHLPAPRPQPLPASNVLPAKTLLS